MSSKAALPASPCLEIDEEIFDDEGEEISFRPGRYDLHQRHSSSLGKGASRLTLSFGTLSPSVLQAFKDLMDTEGLALNSGFFSDINNFELHNAKKLIALSRVTASMFNCPNSICVFIDLSMLYLLPKYRRRGVWSAFAKGIGYAIAENLFPLIDEAEEKSKELDVTFIADTLTTEGHEFFNQMVMFAEAIITNHAGDIDLNINIDAGF